jgi:hypothetical protein
MGMFCPVLISEMLKDCKRNFQAAVHWLTFPSLSYQVLLSLLWTVSVRREILDLLAKIFANVHSETIYGAGIHIWDLIFDTFNTFLQLIIS